MKSGYNFSFWIPVFTGMIEKTWLLLVCAICFSARAGTNEFTAQIEQLSQTVQRHTLDNGMVCIIKEDWTSPLVSIQIWVGSGSAQEGEYLGGGLSHLIEHMIFKGTPKRKPADIAGQINNTGGSINAYTSLDRTVFWVDMPAEHWRTGLDVLADAVLNASFPEDEWRREKDVVRREMAMNNDNPDRVLSKLLWQTAYLVHPYRFPVIGREDIFNTLVRDDLLAFFRRNYTPDNMIIAVVGSVSADSVRLAVENLFSGVGRRARPLTAQLIEPPQLGPRIERKTGAYNISRLEMVWHTVGLSHPDAPALDILSIIAGVGNSSRLGQKIKENRKLAFSIDAWSFTPKDAGLFGISAAFDPADEDELIKAIEDEVAAWRTDSMQFSPPEGATRTATTSDHCRGRSRERQSNFFTMAEIEKARNKIVAETLSAFQTMHGKADTFASGEFYAGAPVYFAAYLRRLADVTPESLSAAADRYLSDNNRTIAILSPPVTNESNSMHGNFKDAAGPEAHALPIGFSDQEKVGRGVPGLLRRSKPSGYEGRTAPSNSNGMAGETKGAPAEINIVKTVFPNGLTLLCREDNRLPFVDVCIASLGGLLMENEKNNGITCLMAELLTRGTDQRSRKEIAEAVETSGGSISSFSGMNSYGLQARCFSKDAGLFMDILSDCWLRPVFAEEEIAKCKIIQAARIERERESPVFLAQESLRQALFAGHPYSLNVEGARESVMAIAREDLRRLHGKTAVGSNTVLAVFGDISAVKAVEIVKGFLLKMPAGQRQNLQNCGYSNINALLQFSPPEWATRTVSTSDWCSGRSRERQSLPCRRPAAGQGCRRPKFPRQIDLTAPREQTIVLCGFPGFAVTDKRMDALNILLEALNGLSSDLMISVRDKKGLAYYTGAYHKTGIVGGQFAVYSGTRAEEAGNVRALIMKEISRLDGKGVRADEFERARQQIISEHRQSRQTNAGLAMECALNELYNLGYAHGIETEKRLAQLTPDDVRQAAAEIMRPGKMVIVTVRPEKK